MEKKFFPLFFNILQKNEVEQGKEFYIQGERGGVKNFFGAGREGICFIFPPRGSPPPPISIPGRNSPWKAPRQQREASFATFWGRGDFGSSLGDDVARFAHIVFPN